MIRHSFIFCSLVAWFKSVYALALDNDFSALFMSTFAVLGVTAAEIMVTDETFGTTRVVIFLVLCTVLLNTGYGIAKSLKKQSLLFAKAVQHPFGSDKYLMFLQRSERYKFDIKRLQFVFFKCFVFLGYLYFAQKLLEDGGSFLDFSAQFLTKVPVAIFWYYEFKSFGENSEFVYGKKASPFKIVEMFFEPKIFQLFGSKTPTDGVHKDVQLNPEDYGLNDEILRDHGHKDHDTNGKPEDNPGT